MREVCFAVTLLKQRSVTAVLDVPGGFDAGTTPVVVLAHGAGADMRSAFMETHAGLLCERGLCVLRFNFPYKETGGRRPPDRMDVLLSCYLQVVIAASQRTGSPPGPLFLGGKSMGGRVATLLAASGKVKPSGFVLLGYPLHPPGKPDQLRKEHLPALRAPVLFVQGTRDPLCDLELLRATRKECRVSGSLHVVEGGDHSLTLPRSQAARQDAVDGATADVVRTFVDRVCGRASGG